MWPFEEKRGLSAWGTEWRVPGGICWCWAIANTCSSRRGTNRHSHGRTLLAEQLPTPILPGSSQPVISVDHGGRDAYRKGRAVELKQPGFYT